MSRQAQALWFQAPRQVGLGRVELPSLSEGHLLVRTLMSGISTGTELLAYRGELDPDLVLDEAISSLGASFSFPFRYGYSCVGRVESSLSPVPEGSLVFAFHPHQDVFVVSTADVVPLDEAVDPRFGVLFPLLETALQVSLDAGSVTHDVVVVVGLGVVGMLVALFLARSGAQVVASEPRQWRREVAATLGIEALHPGELPERVLAATQGRGAPLAVEVSGQPEALVATLPLLAHEGTALVASWYGDKRVSLPLGGAFHRRRLTIRSTQVSTIPAHLAGRWTIERRRKVARSLLAQLPLQRLASHEFAFADAASAFAALDRGDEGLLHVALRYEQPVS